MTENKEPKAEEKKEEKPVEKAEETPKWAIELSAKLDKMADAFLKLAETKQEEEPKEEEKPVEEEPKEEEKQEEEPKEEEEKMPPEEEEKVSKADVAKMVEEGIKKALSTAPEKKSKVPTDPEVANVLTYEKIAKMSWEEVAELSKKMGSA